MMICFLPYNVRCSGMTERPIIFIYFESKYLSFALSFVVKQNTQVRMCIMIGRRCVIAERSINYSVCPRAMHSFGYKRSATKAHHIGPTHIQKFIV